MLEVKHRDYVKLLPKHLKGESMERRRALKKAHSGDKQALKSKLIILEGTEIQRHQVVIKQFQEKQRRDMEAHLRALNLDLAETRQMHSTKKLGLGDLEEKEVRELDIRVNETLRQYRLQMADRRSELDSEFIQHQAHIAQGKTVGRSRVKVTVREGCVSGKVRRLFATVLNLFSSYFFFVIHLTRFAVETHLQQQW